MTDHADIGEYGLHTNWENCEGGLCCDEALAIMEALVAERDEARNTRAVQDAGSIRKVEAYDAARAEVKRDGYSRAEYV